MDQELVSLQDALTAIQIKLAALESLLLSNDALRAEYEWLVDSEAKKVLVARIPVGKVC